MRALLVLNEKSRRGMRDGQLVCRTLEEIGIECVRDPAVKDVAAVIAAGGDGTVIRTAPIAIDRKLPLGIVPLGTFNDLAKTLGVPAGIEDACRAILAGKTRRIDVGRVNDTYFVNEASVGLSTRIARKQTPEVKQRFGALAIVATTLQSVRAARSFYAEVHYDGKNERMRTLQITIANNARFGGIIEREDAAIDDGWLDLYSIEVKKWWQAFKLARKAIARDPRSGDGLRTRRSTSFTVQTRHPHHIAADGEPAGMTPATFEIVPQALEVLIP